MGIKRAAQVVKGTTRVSFGDRQLIKKLWIANKNTRGAKSKRTREMNREYTLKLSQAPHRRICEAYTKWSKRMNGGESGIELKETDEKEVVMAMTKPDWDYLVDRHARVLELAAAFRQVKSAGEQTGRRSDERTQEFIAELSAVCKRDSECNVPYLVNRKHIRAQNFRRRADFKNRIFSNFPARKRAFSTSSTVSNGASLHADGRKTRTGQVSQIIRVDNENSSDYTNDNNDDNDNDNDKNNSGSKEKRSNGSDSSAARFTSCPPSENSVDRVLRKTGTSGSGRLFRCNGGVYLAAFEEACSFCAHPIESGDEEVVENHGRFNVIRSHAACYAEAHQNSSRTRRF